MGLPSAGRAAPEAPASPATADPARSLSDGNALKQVDACAEALFHYDAAMAGSAPGEGLWEAAAYNRGVCLELLERLDEAVATYDAIVRRSPSGPAVADALFRRGLTHALAGRPARARRDFHRARARLRATDEDALRRIDVQLGSLDLLAGRKLRAVERLGAAVVALREEVQERPTERWYLAQALVGLGDLHRMEAARALPRGSLAALTAALGERAGALGTAQDFYVEAAQQQQPTWTAAATLHLGEGFLDLGSRLLEIRDEPGDLSALERAGLAAWIDGRSPDLHRKARDAFRLCADVFTEMGLDDRSTRACRSALEGFPEERLRPPVQPTPK